MKNLFTSILLVFIVSVSVFCQPPQSFKYQAVVRDASGELIANQSVDIRISIRNGSPGGTIVYQETFLETTNQFGLVNLQIGTGTVLIGTFSVIDWSSGLKFMQVDYKDGAYYLLLGTTELSSVPYALYSLRSADWTRNGNNLFAANTGFVGIGTQTQNGKLAVHDDAGVGIFGESASSYGIYGRTSASAGSGVIGEGLTSGSWGVYGYNGYGGVAVRGYSNGGFGGYFIGDVYVSDMTGIGTTSPSYPLHVKKSHDDWLAGIHNESWSATAHGLVVRADGGDPLLVQSSGTNVFYVKHSGNIGIGTSTPDAKLHVEDRIRIGEDPSYASVYGELIHAGSSTGFKINANASGGWADMHLQTDGTTRLFIESAGNVGIGTTSPTETLDVNGSGRIRGSTSGTIHNGVYQTSDGTLITGSSDIRLKENIEPLLGSLEKVKQLQGVSFTWKADPDAGKSIGFIAQGFEKVVPELVYTNQTDGYKGINYAEVTALLTEAIKEQQKIIETLQNRIEKLEKPKSE
ncbi:MAG: tail fiber domain-containing protein [Bacteroidales bacterium]|nr:tail fiber domain-containing protein [Bacteroidales bacterium]